MRLPAELRMPGLPIRRITVPVRQLRDGRLGSVIWATGHAFDFCWIVLSVLNASGEPVHARGVAPVLDVFLGLPWLSTMRSLFLPGLGDGADCIAEHIQRRKATSLRSGLRI
jgi:hypothetical protein